MTDFQKQKKSGKLVDWRIVYFFLFTKNNITNHQFLPKICNVIFSTQ